MKKLVFVLCALFTINAMAQDSFTEADAQKIVDVFFEGFHKGDTLQMRSVIGDDVVMQTAFLDTKGNNRLSTGSLQNLLNAIANRPAEQKWDERLMDYKVQIDGNLAHVWTPYEFWVNGEFSHCGANAFTLAKSDDGWKIIHLIDSRRRASCNE